MAVSPVTRHMVRLIPSTARWNSIGNPGNHWAVIRGLNFEKFSAWINAETDIANPVIAVKRASHLEKVRGSSSSKNAPPKVR